MLIFAAMKSKERLSNIELLRIVSMLMVVCVHLDGASLGLPELHGRWAGMSGYDFWRLAVESLAIVGVNCFTMISGYFGVKLRWRGVGVYLFECVFYAVGIYTVVALVSLGFFTWRGWAESWLVLTHTDLWYVPAYFGLMLLSPILNAGLGAFTRRQFAVLLAAFGGWTVWGGWWWGGSFNPTGYTLLQLVLMYMAGRFVGLHVSPDALRLLRPWSAAAYLASAAGVVVMAVYLPSGQAFAYNSPMVMAETVALFMLFAGMRLRSRTVNYIARSAFAVYLIHKAPLVWGNVMRPGVIYLERTLPGWQFVAACVGIMVGFYLLAMALDIVRRWLSRVLFGR